MNDVVSLRPARLRPTRAAVAAGAFAVAALSLASAARAGVEPDVVTAVNSAPVVATCTVGHRSMSTFAYSTAFASGLAVSYRDADARPASSVALRVEYDGRRTIVTDAFPLASNAAVTRSYRTLDGASYTGRTARCEVASVTFADGSTWTPQSPAAEAPVATR